MTYATCVRLRRTRIISRFPVDTPEYISLLSEIPTSASKFEGRQRELSGILNIFLWSPLYTHQVLVVAVEFLRTFRSDRKEGSHFTSKFTW